MIKVAILGATGYTGEELLRLLSKHPQAEITLITSDRSAGKTWGELFPQSTFCQNLLLEKMDVASCTKRSDLVFTCLPHGQSAPMVKLLVEKNHPVIDLAADFRIKDAQSYQQYYGTHPFPQLLTQATYGLPELWRNEIKKSKFIANPGCYPTSITLALAPLLKAKLIATEPIICDSKSGMSGAGRQTVEEVHRKEMPENFKAYKVIGHRHTPEIEQNLSQLAGVKINVSFTPHLLPIHRGILSTIYVKAKTKLTHENLLKIYQDFYQQEPFIKIIEEESPELRNVQFTNECHLAAHINPTNNIITLLSAIDNLTKGASGQAIQNMNLMFGLDEKMGL